ncbi:unnamed protein product [Blepharisma stoltei]|uniref:U2A'/phosphoprotein 32 family A C-terminal domain-containing protein n=1 Tax=Blepharisma stoltei TaxID=1481888 RepID=A0AAU9I4W8_9CILI|nr:unnamed protein product [Blepharisma stoltei]
MDSGKKSKKSLMSEDEILQNLGRWGGLEAEQIIEKTSVTKIEISLEVLDNMSFLSSFENIRSLTLVALMIEKIEGLNHMQFLEEVWLDQNFISKIEGLEFSVNLKRLHISNNKIEIIEGLENCENLEVLWLNENKIDSLDGLWRLKSLKQLWVAKNKIVKIGSTLTNLKKLYDLNLSGNLIGSFKDVLNLKSLPALDILTLNDPHFTENPVCNLCNYQTFMIFQFPKVKKLDTYSITDEARSYAEATFLKKQMYYNMRIKTIKRTASNIKIALTNLAQKYQQFLFDDLLPLEKELKLTESECENRMNPKESIGELYIYNPANALDSEPISVIIPKLQKKTQALQKEISREYKNIKNVDNICHLLQHKVERMCKENINRLITELDTGGNIRFEEGKPADNWYTSCVDLLLSRYKGLPQVKVTKVTRIHNRFLRNRFEEKLDQVTDTSSSTYKRSLEYLFYGIDTNLPSEIHRVMEEGFRTPDEYRDINLPGCIPLVNSVQTAELSRLRSCDIETDRIFQSSGQLLICKVFIGDGVEESKVSTYRSKMTVAEAWHQLPVRPEGKCWAVHRTREDDPKIKLWFIFDNTLVLPEYLVEFEYVGGNLSLKEIPEGLETEELEKSELSSFTLSLSAFIDLCKTDHEIKHIKIDPKLPKRSTIAEITEQALYKASKELNILNITSLNLSCNNISNLSAIKAAENLEHLCLSFNCVESIEDLKGCYNLRKLDLSHNLITWLDYVEGLVSLEALHISHNNIADIRNLFKLNHVKELLKLSMIGNPIASHTRYRQLILISSKKLAMLDWEKIPSDEKEEFSSQSTISITLDMVKSQSSFEIDIFSKPKTDWIMSQEKLILNNQKLTTLQGVEIFNNLKVLSCAGNMIKEIAGLNRCILLEELCLENNMISIIENLQSLVYLKKLNLGRNFISKIENLKDSKCLTQLSLEDNLIESLAGVEDLQGIMELYIWNNKLSNLKEILLLKGLPKLMILDIYGNPLSKEQNSRLYMIFNLKKLKVLDGVGVESSEQHYAKESYGGKLSEDILQSRLNGIHQFDIRVLDLSSAKLKSFDNVFNQELFPNLVELNLTDNHLVSLRCFGFMPRLAKLQLCKNKIESLSCNDAKGISALPNLEALDLSYNSLESLYGLQFGKLSLLRVLVCSNNQIENIEYLENLINLRELDLAANNIKQIDFNSLANQPNLRFLRLDENRIRSLSNLGHLAKLQCLQIASNRIQDYLELDKLGDLNNLMELGISNNPISRKTPYRISVIKRIPQLMFLDGQDVTPDEKEKIDNVQDVKPSPLVHLAPQNINKLAGIKLTSVNLDTVFGKSEREQNKKPPSAQLGNVLGVTPLTSLLKGKGPKGRR